MVKVIPTDAEYQVQLKRIQELMMDDPLPESATGNELRLLALVVADYEARTYQTDPPDPIEALVFRMEQQDLRPADLVPYIGSRGRVSEILARKRSLTLPMIRRLYTGLGIPAEVLLQEPQPDTPLRDDALSV